MTIFSSSIAKQNPFTVFFQDVLVATFDSYLSINDLYNVSLTCKMGKKIADLTFKLRANEYGCPPLEEEKSYLSSLYKIVDLLNEICCLPESAIQHYEKKEYLFKVMFLRSYLIPDREKTLLNISKLGLEDIGKLYSNEDFYYIEKTTSCFHHFLLKKHTLPVPNSSKSDTSKLNKALFLSLANKDYYAAKFILEKGANPNSYFLSCQTPLLYASMNNREEFISLLVDYKADPNVGSPEGILPIHKAAETGNIKALELLLEKTKVDENGPRGNTALHYAVKNNQFEAAELLLKKKANPSIQSESGHTPLTCATKSGFFDITQLLIKYGADLSSSHQNGSLPLHFAAQNGHNQIVIDLLQENQAMIDIQGCAKTTALAFAAEALQLPTVILLLEMGANPNSPGCTWDNSSLRPSKAFHRNRKIGKK